MTYLAFDTSASPGSVAVGDPEGGVAARRFLTRREAHAALLMPAVEDALEEAGCAPAELRGVVVGAGPGSFTGLRVAAATAKGLVHALGLPLYAFSSLAAAAVTVDLDLPAPASPDGDDDLWDGADPSREPTPDIPRASDAPPKRIEPIRVVLFDARGGRLYGGVYRVTEAQVRTLVEPRAADISELPDWDLPPNAFFCGRGAVRHEEWITDHGYEVIRAPYGSMACGVPSAEGLIRLLGLVDDPEPVAEPTRWEPEYLRAWKPQWERTTKAETG